MQTQTIRREDRMMANSYREFSRKRYAELKDAHKGGMRETEIIQKIIREWDDMKMSKRGRSGIRALEPPATPMRDDKMMEIDVKIKSKLKSTSAKKEEMDNKMKEEMMMVNVQPFDAGMSMPMSEQKTKTKMIQKGKKINTYISFYKENFAHMMAIHPLWTPIQITQIVKLMWQREKSMRGMSKKKAFKTTPTKTMTGRMFFKRFKMREGISAEQVMKKWKRLPKDSRRMYDCRGNPEAMPNREKEMNVMMTRSMKMTNGGLSAILKRK